MNTGLALSFTSAGASRAAANANKILAPLFNVLRIGEPPLPLDSIAWGALAGKTHGQINGKEGEGLGRRAAANPRSFAAADAFQKHSRDLLSVLAGLFVSSPALLARKAVTQTVDALQGKTRDESARPRDGRLGNKPTAERNLAHQFARQGSPSERSRHDRGNLGPLLAITHRAVAACSQQKCHANLVHCQES